MIGRTSGLSSAFFPNRQAILLPPKLLPTASLSAALFVMLPSPAVLGQEHPAVARTTSGVGGPRPPAVVLSVQGVAHIQHPGAGSNQAEAGHPIYHGSQVKTGPRGTVVLQLPDTSRLQLQPNSVLRWTRHHRRKNLKRRLILLLGKVASWIRHKPGPDRPFEIVTANAVAGVRGTHFDTTVSQDGTAWVTVGEGRVEVTSVHPAAAAQDITSPNDQNETKQRQQLTPGQGLHALETGLTHQAPNPPTGDTPEQWRQRARARLQNQGLELLRHHRRSLRARHRQLALLRERQRKIVASSSVAGAAGRSTAQHLADQIADHGDVAEAQFALVDHVADLARDPKFRMIDQEQLLQEAASLRRIRDSFEAMVQEGTDISMKAMEEMLHEMRDKKPNQGKQRLQPGSTRDELFGDTP